MALRRRERSYDRSRLLDRARRAHAKGKHKKAIAAYRQVLEVEPANSELRRKLASLLARVGERAEAWTHYRACVEALGERGFADQAIGVLREASGHLAREVELWISLAELEHRRGRPVDAHRTLLHGREQFRRRRQRPQAIRLLLEARKLAPRDFRTNFELAGMLAKAGGRRRARSLLQELARTATGRELRRIRARELWIAPSPATAWRWLCALPGRRRRWQPPPARGRRIGPSGTGGRPRGASALSGRSRPGRSPGAPSR